MFMIDRNGGGTLCEQIAEGFRRAIAADEYKPGDRLPQMRELAAHFGVSIRVVVRAFAKLETERLVAGRRGVGCVVTKPPTSFWKAVGIRSPIHFSRYYLTQLMEKGMIE